MHAPTLKMFVLLEKENKISSTYSNFLGKGAPYFTRDLENCFVGEGGAAKLICRCQGNPEPEVTWYKEKEKLVEGKQFTILFDADENCVLIITQSNHDTAGLYACVASNSFGTAKSTAMLYVEGLQTEYDSETEDEVSDPEPQPERGEIAVRKDKVENHYILQEELGRYEHNHSSYSSYDIMQWMGKIC